MSRRKVTAVNGSAAILLSTDLLTALGVGVGDEVDVVVVDGVLVVRSLDEAARASTVEAVAEAMFQRRRTVYQELARGRNET